MNAKSVILKSENQTQVSVTRSIEGIGIQKIVMPISPLGFINLMHHADSKVNPRKAKINLIVKAIEERKAFIEGSLETARKANEQLANIQKEGERILAEAKEKQNLILKEAVAEKEHIIDEAHKKAAAEAHLQIEEATRRIREEKERAIREVRAEITDLSIAIAEKVMQDKISRDKSQEVIINKLLDEMSIKS